MSRYLLKSSKSCSLDAIQKSLLADQRYYSTATDRSDFLKAFIHTSNPPPDTVKYFTSVDWAQKYLNSNDFENIPFFSRHWIQSSGENTFFARTVNTATTVPLLLALRSRNLSTPQNQDAATTLPTAEIPEALCLISFGRDLQSHPSIVHGGFQCVIFDEIMRLVVLLHQDNISEPGPRDAHFTVSMTTTFHAPLRAPSDVLARSQLVKREGRKWFVKADIVDSAGSQLTSAESTWVTKKREYTLSN